MKRINIQFIAQSAIIAALYAALTWLLAPISYGAIQFRVSEILVLLVVFNPKYAFALVIGCFVANTTSSLGWYDMVFGTIATLLGILPMLKIKRLEIAGLFPVISNAIIVAIELFIVFEEPIWFSILTVGLGEAVVIYCLGIPAMQALRNNEGAAQMLALDTESVKTFSWFTKSLALAVFVGALGIILYIAYPIATDASGLVLTHDYPWVAVSGVLCGGLILTGLIKNKTIKLSMNIVWILGLLVCFILFGIYIPGSNTYPYYYGYIVYLLLISLYTFYIFKNEQKIEV